MPPEQQRCSCCGQPFEPFPGPTCRLLAEWETRGLDLSPGTITDGLQRLAPLFEPVYQKLIEHNQKQTFWHADETGWWSAGTLQDTVTGECMGRREAHRLQ